MKHNQDFNFRKILLLTFLWVGIKSESVSTTSKPEVSVEDDYVNPNPVPVIRLEFSESSSSSSESGSVEVRDTQIGTFDSLTQKSSRPTIHSPSELNSSEELNTSTPDNLTPTKIFQFAEVLINISASMCPKVGSSFLDTLNKFLAATLTKPGEKEEQMSPIDELIFRDNFRKLKECRNFVQSKVNKASSKTSVPDYYDSYSTEKHISNSKPSTIKKSKITNGKSKKDEFTSYSVEVVEKPAEPARKKREANKVSRQYPQIIFLIELMSNIMRELCLHTTRPHHHFMTYFAEHVSFKVGQAASVEANKGLFAKAMVKYTKLAALKLQQLQVCKNNISKHMWLMDHGDDYMYD